MSNIIRFDTSNTLRLKRYLKARNSMLLKNDPDALINFHRKWNLAIPSSREMAEVTLHKARTAIVSLPLEERKKSKQWLTERGYHSLDDGDL